MLKPEEKIREKLELYEKIVDRKVGKLETGKIPKDNVSQVYLSVGNKSHAVGLYKLALGECDSAVLDFVTSAEWYYKGTVKTRDQRESISDDFEGETTLLKYLYSALLTSEEELVIQAAKLANDTSVRHYHQFSTIHRYYFMQAITATILNKGDQQEYISEMEKSLTDLDGTTKTFFEALWIALSGITKEDRERFRSGIEQLLEWHDQKTDFKNKTSANDLVSRQAIALITLARRKGIDVYVDSEYIPECIYEID